MSEETLIYPERLLPRCRERFPDLSDLIDLAEINIPAMRVLAETWYGSIRAELPMDGTEPPPTALCSLFASVAVHRGVALAEGLARELEADALLPAGSVARSLIELVGLASHARSRLPRVAGSPVDAERLSREAWRFLMGQGRSANDVPPYFKPGDLVNAAKKQFGDHLGDDYDLLSNISHPNGLLVFAPWTDAWTLDLRQQSISEAYAEVLIKVCGNGIGVLGHNALWVHEWAGSLRA